MRIVRENSRRVYIVKVGPRTESRTGKIELITGGCADERDWDVDLMDWSRLE